MIIRARVIVTMDGDPIEDGAVVTCGDRIADVGRFADIRRRNGGAVTDFGEVAVLPGLINAHCHLEYTLLRGAIPPQKSFAEWIGAINAAKARLQPEDYLRGIDAGFREAAEFGTTAIANYEAFPELLDRIPPPPMRTWWFAEMIDLREKLNVTEILRIMRGGFDREKWRGGLGLAPHAPYTASGSLYSDAADLARRENILLSTHLGESQEEMQMFRDSSGPLFGFMKSFGRQINDCGAGSPLAAILEHMAPDERWIVAHVNELSENDFALLERVARFHIVHCPRSHCYFGHAPFPLQRLCALGFNICVGTDSLASNVNLSLLAELRELQQNEPSVTARELVEMATLRGAAALSQGSNLGRIQSGFLADLIAIPASPSGHGTYDDIVAFEGVVPWAMIAGEVLPPNP
ncbi:MAG: amidohydrolase family protein [Chthoniobacterales bacterium]